LSLDGDDDPVRFWTYVIEAFRVVEPGFGEDVLTLLQGPTSPMSSPRLARHLTSPLTVETHQRKRWSA
jgi:hypothetical protein